MKDLNKPKIENKVQWIKSPKPLFTNSPAIVQTQLLFFFAWYTDNNLAKPVLLNPNVFLQQYILLKLEMDFHKHAITCSTISLQPLQ